MNYEYALIVEETDASLKIERGSIPLKVETGRTVERPAYTGPNVFIPSAEKQIIEIAGKRAEENIVIDPIPSNYGLITWNGSFLTVS